MQLTAEWDIVIAGGGATGLGAAIDAASRGYKTLLVEKYDFAKGTSGRSTKLIHGGVRYLSQGNIKLVRESLRERGLLLRNAPHVCKPVTFVLPVFSLWEKCYYAIGLKLYDWLSGNHSLGASRILSAQQAGAAFAAISNQKISGAITYTDGQFDDSRLAVNLAQTAADAGATILNYCTLHNIHKKNGRIHGIEITDGLTGKQYQLQCKSLINATGVFSDELMLKDEPAHHPVIAASKGVHIVTERHFFPGNNALIIPKTDDGRVLFAVPWHDKLVVGTTDTPEQKIEAEPVPEESDISFILSHINRYLSTPILHRDILSVFAGLRPLLASGKQQKTSLLSRDLVTIVSKSGMVTVTGGKWTTYRFMGKQAVDKAASAGNLPKLKSNTALLKIHGYCTGKNEDDFLSLYGTDKAHVLELMKYDPSLGEKIHPQLPYNKAMVIWAVRAEMAVTVEDVLARRTRALLLNAQAAIDSAVLVASMMASELQLPGSWEKEQVKNFIEIARNYIIH